MGDLVSGAVREAGRLTVPSTTFELSPWGVQPTAVESMLQSNCRKPRKTPGPEQRLEELD